MKLLFDQNISFRIIHLLKSTFQNCKHVNDVGLDGKSDSEIWEFAKLNGYTIVTFDSDFYDLAVIKGIPPKIVWLRLGNTNTLTISHTLIQKKDLISDFCRAENENVCLEISKTLQK